MYIYIILYLYIMQYIIIKYNYKNLTLRAKRRPVQYAEA